MKKSIKANNKNVKTIVITILIIILIIIAIGSILILNKKNKTPSILNREKWNVGSNRQHRKNYN